MNKLSFKVEAIYVPQCIKYIKEGKTYDAVFINEHQFSVVDDCGDTIFCRLNNLDDNIRWRKVEMNDTQSVISSVSTVGTVNGDPILYVKHEIKYGRKESESTSLRLELFRGEICSTAYHFNGIQNFNTGPGTVEELRRFKTLLNSFPEL